MRIHRLLAALALASASALAMAQDRPYDTKALARYDSSYAVCEVRYPQMAGHKDEAYLSLWRIKVGPKSAARLAQARGNPAYKAERQRVAQTAAKPAAAAASSPLDRQCRGLWGEFERAPKAKS
jgi:hypothetical protein